MEIKNYVLGDWISGDGVEIDHIHAITGEIIMKNFNIGPCKEIGIIKEKIKNAILDGDILNDYDEAFELMIKIGELIGLKNEENI